MKNIKVFIIYCHPSKNSFTNSIKEEFIRGLEASKNQYEISDLYGMNFNETFSEYEYLREAYYDNSILVPEDVFAEQQKINNADMIVFIYPVFWTEAPVKLVGWFQRVLTFGFAYGNEKTEDTMKQLSKALFLVTMGGCLKDSVRKEQVKAMEVVMLGDRINDRAKEKKMIIFDQMSRDFENDGKREENSVKFLKQAYEIGLNI